MDKGFQLWEPRSRLLLFKWNKRMLASTYRRMDGKSFETTQGAMSFKSESPKEVAGAFLYRSLVLTLLLAGSSGWEADLHAEDGKVLNARDSNEKPIPNEAICRLGTSRWRHPGEIQRLAFAPNNKWIATSGQGAMCIWDVGTGKELGHLPRLRGELNLLLFSPDSQSIAVGTEDGFIQIYRTTNLERIAQITGKSGGANVGIFSSDSHSFLMATRNKITLWDIQTGAYLGQFVGHNGNVQALALSPNRKLIASGGGDFTVKVWDASSFREIIHLRGHTGPVEFTAFSADGKALLSASKNGSIYFKELFVWDLDAGTKTVIAADKLNEVRSLAISPDGKNLAIGSIGGDICLLALKEPARIKWSQKGSYSGESLAFSPDGKLLASGCVSQVLHLWDVETGKLTNQLGWEHQDWITKVAFACGDKSVVSGSRDHTIRLWKLGVAGDSRQLPCKSFFGTFAVNAAGNLLAQVDAYGVFIWDLQSLKIQTRIPETEAVLDKFTHFLEFPGTSKKLIAGDDDNQIVLCSLEERKILLESERRPWGSCYYSLSPEGSFLVSTYAQRQFPPQPLCTISCLDLKDGKERSKVAVTDAFVTSVAMSPLGKKLAYGCGNGVVRVLDALSGKTLRELRTAGGKISCCLFASDGKTLVTAGEDCCIHLWEIETGEERKSLRGHSGEITCLAFSSDGKMLASGSKDTSVLLWDLTGLRKSKAAPRLSTERLKTLWEDLAREDGKQAYHAIWMMTGSSETALPFLRARLGPVQRIEPAQMRKWIKDLDSASFLVRSSAQKSLELTDDLAGPFLREAKNNKPSLETRRRIEALLERIRTKPSKMRIRLIRSIEILETIKNKDSIRILESLGKGPPESEVTQEAKMSIERLKAKKLVSVHFPLPGDY